MPSQFVLAAGSNAHGQLATGTRDDVHIFTASNFVGHPPGAVPSGTTLSQLACGANHTLALLSSPQGTELWGAGDGRRGQLGPSYTSDIRSASSATGTDTTAGFRPLALEAHIEHLGLRGCAVRCIAAGWETSYVVLSSAERSDVLLAMGANDFGDSASARRRSLHPARRPARSPLAGHAGGCRLDAHNRVSRSRTAPRTGRAKATRQDGSTHMLVVGWGASRHGQLGAAPSASARSPAFYATPRIMLLPPSWQRPGSQHTVLLHSSGRLAGLGTDRKGQLAGIGALEDVRAVACAWNGTYALVEPAGQDGWSVLAAGSHMRGQLGRPMEVEAGALAARACFCLVTLEPDVREVWGWGWNEHGNLGVGSTEDVPLPVRLWPSMSEGGRDGQVMDVWCGCGTSWIVIER
ncbi:regulator of chromosome condensation 1/beta-lactamase-inhibitor protein II [Amylocystis lapponica]|nr:regulator of chromosome condensation 1/beta-lactamase-inhibitor protein II [Amylocystis lapponica]